jgi:hypothetical protein
LEQIAIKTGIRQDLEVVFDGNYEIVDDILTLAMFPYLTKNTFNRVARWQRVVKSPSKRELTPSTITKLTQFITEQHRMDLLKLRAGRLGKNELCAVDSTTRSAYGDSLADIRWGKNKERIPLAQTTEVVVYTLSGHMPIYYRTFPGNIPDSRTLDVIIKDLEHAGFDKIILITDRGYDTIHNLEKYLLRNQPMIMCVKTSHKDVVKEIDNFGNFGVRPTSMEIDSDEKIYYKQYEVNYDFKNADNSRKNPLKIKINLYFDIIRRDNDLIALDIALKEQGYALDEMIKDKIIMPDDTTIKNDFCYYKVIYDPVTRKLLNYKLNDSKIDKSKNYSGFFSIITYKVDFDAMKTFNIYKLRDEQEKYFQQMKGQMVSDRQRNWSEEGKTGRLLILFVSLVLGSYVRHIWKSTSLHDKLSSSLDILDEMKPIRCIEHTNRARVITPFVGDQLDICEAFGFEIPKGCAPAYPTHQKPKRKRGRPPKKRSS